MRRSVATGETRGAPQIFPHPNGMRPAMYGFDEKRGAKRQRVYLGVSQRVYLGVSQNMDASLQDAET